MRKKQLELPLLPTTTVGSNPQTQEMRVSRSKVRAGKITEEELIQKEIGWVKEIIDEQEKFGIDIIVDGEPYRQDMVAYFAEKWLGYEEGGFVRSYGNRYYRKPNIMDRIQWKPATRKYWERAQAMTDKPVKGMLTGAYTMMDWSFNEFYPNRREATLALAQVVRQEISDLVAAGAKIVQIDEPALSVRSDELGLAIEAMEIMVDGFDSTYFVSHVCYGEFHKIYPGILQLPVDQLDLELACSAFDLFEMFEKHPFTKDIGLGVFDIHSHQVPSVEDMKRRIHFALRYLKPEQIFVDPDCGGKTRTTEQWSASLKNMAIAASEVRHEIGG